MSIKMLAASTPPNPGANYAQIYYDGSDRRPMVIDETGAVYPLGSANRKNYILNGSFAVVQRQAPATLTTYTNLTGRTYTADRWAVTNENASVQFQSVDTMGAPESGLQARHYGRWKKITGAGKLVLSQAIEATSCAEVRDHQVRVGLKLRCSVASSLVVNVGLAQLTSAGSPDVIPATFVSAFNGAGTDPTLGLNLAYIAPGSTPTVLGGNITGGRFQATLGTSWTQCSATYVVPSNAKNLFLLVWTNGQMAANDEINLAEVGLYDGLDVPLWSAPALSDQLAQCQRFYCKTFAQGVAPITNGGVASGAIRGILGKASTTALAAQLQWQFPTTMRSAPAVILYNPGAANNAVRQISGTAGDLTATAATNITDRSVDITATGLATGTVGDQVGVHATAESEI